MAYLFKPVIKSSKLPLESFKFLVRYLEEQVSTENSKKDITQVSKYITTKSTLSAEEWHILNIAHYYLEEAGLKGDISKSYIEIWRYRLFGDKIESALPKHRDSYGTLFGPVNTVIFYLRKDKTIKGGDLEIYRNILLSWNPIAKYECSAGNVLVFEGSLVHKVETLKGTGIRDCIVVQMRCPMIY